jgi:phosphodiesterase/alkaline phosphatase D-like protein
MVRALSLRTIVLVFLFFVCVFFVSSQSAGQTLAPGFAGILANEVGEGPNGPTTSVPWSGARSIVVVGNYAYVTALDDKFAVIDISTPYQPAPLGYLTNGVDDAQLQFPYGLAVQGNYAYVASYQSSALEIIDISNPLAPAHAGYIPDGGGGGAGAKLNLAQCVAVVGNNAFVGSQFGLAVIDVTDKANPTNKGYIQFPFGNVVSIAIVGNYAYVGGNVFFAIVDITDPANPVLAGGPDPIPNDPDFPGTIQDGEGGAKLSYVTSVKVVGNYAYVTAQQDNALEIIDISDPGTPTHVAFVTSSAGAATISSPSSVCVQGNYAFITNQGATAYEIVDISTPTAPVHATKLTSTTSGPFLANSLGSTISGNYVYLGTGGGFEVLYLYNTPPPVAVIPTSATSSSLTANWRTVHNSDGYYLDASADNFTTFLPGFEDLQIAAGTTSQLITGLTPSSSYSYRVRSYNENGTSGNSNTITAMTTTETPAVAIVDVTRESVTLEWDAVAGATNYKYFISQEADFDPMEAHGPGQTTATTITIPQLMPVTTYYMAVVAENAGGTSGAAIVSTTTAPVAPTIQAVEDGDIAETAFTIRWVGIPGTASIRIDVASDAGLTSFVDPYNNYLATGGNEEQLQDVFEANTTYYVAVRGLNSIGIASVNSEIVPYLTLPHEPTAIAATGHTTGGFQANWTGDLTVDRYRVDVSANEEFTAILGSYNNRQVIAPTQLLAVTGLSAGTTYYYRVRTSNATGDSPSSNTIAVTTAPPAPVLSDAASVTEGEFTAQWSASTGATNYVVEVATDAGFVAGFQQLDADAATSLVVNGLTPGTQYYFRVRASLVSGLTEIASANSNVKIVVTRPVAPVPTAASITVSSFTLNWNSVSGATEYRYDVATDNSFAVPVASFFNQLTSGTSANITGLVAATTYYARVYAKNSAGLFSAASTTVLTLTVPNAPTITAPATNLITSSSFRVSWTGPGASSYFVDVATDAGFTSLVTNFDNLEVIGANFLDVNTGLQPHTTYYVRVRSANTTGASLNSATEDYITRTDVPATTITLITANSFTLSWSDVGATEYRYDVATDNSFAIPVTAYYNQTTTGTTVSITGLLAATTYYTRVYSANSAGLLTVASSTVIALTVPNPPTLGAVSEITLTSFKIAWTAPGATSYFLDIATDVDFTNMVGGYDNIPLTGATLLQVPGLQANTTYYVRIRSANATGSSVSSSTKVIVTLADALTATAATLTTQGTFQANWAQVVGADKYFIDVSENDDFNPMLTNYNNREVAATNAFLNVTGLTPGAVYYYRVRSSNTSGTSPNSNVITTATLPPLPVLNNPASITETSFVASWSASSGATGYFLDVSTEDTFASRLTGYDNKSLGDITSTSITGLTTNSTYYYRIRAGNLGGSTVSTTAKLVITAPSPPVATAATNVGQTTLVANWNAVSGVSDYRIDVSASDTFSPLTIDNVLVSGSTSFAVTTLSGGTTYYYRVRAVNATAASANSNIISQLTVPATPTPLAASPIGQTSFKANWNAASSATEYFIDVKDPDGNILAGYANASTGTDTFLDVNTGIEAGTTYSYVVRAKNATGLTPGSLPQAVLTVPPTPVALPANTVTRTSFFANWEASKSATQYFITVTNSSGGPLPGYTGVEPIAAKNGETQTAQIQVNGSEQGDTFFYKVTAKNASGPTGASEVMTVNTPAVSFPTILLPTSGTTATYKIISIPDGTTPSTTLSDASFGTSWRIMHYDTPSKANVDVPHVADMDAGFGYWVNSNIDPAPSITLTGQTLPSTKTLTLLPGWNQIGNPFNFDISWSAVLLQNDPVEDVGNLYTYNVPNVNGQYTEYDGLKGYGGGFVNNQSNPPVNITLTIPADVTRFNGRRGARNAINSRDIAGDEWFIPITVEAGGKFNDLGGFGMHPNARASMDRFDAIALPRFAHMPDLSSNHPEFFQPRFMKDVVPTANMQTWKFDINMPEQSSDARLTWDNTGWGNAELYLIDEGAGAVINMSEMNEYAFTSHRTKSITFAYGRHGLIAPDITVAGQPFPNPSADRVTFPFVARQGETISIHVIDLTGRNIGSMKVDNAMSGYQEAIWDSKETGGLPPGVYLYQFTTSAGVRKAGRIVLK